MTLMRPLSGIALAAFVLAAGLASPQSAKAEDLVDFLWGGSAEYGGGRSVVSFDPKYKPNQIIVSFSDRRLYLITKPGQAITYPVAIPMGEARWQGVTFVSSKKVNPPWTPTPEMVRQNPRLPRWVPGGHPMNPLGVRAMYLGSSAYRIHGTDAPWTIGQPVSHGCIRLTNQDVLDLYPRVNVGMRVTVTWQQFTTTPVASGDDSSYSSGSSYSHPYYTSSGKASMARTASSRPSDGSLSNIFFWNDDSSPTQAAQGPAPQTTEKQAASDKQQDSDDATVDRASDEQMIGKKSSDKQASEKQTSEKQASAEEKPAPSKKKLSSEPASKKKSTATASTSGAAPASTGTQSAPAAAGPVLDPKATMMKSTDAAPEMAHATKASASATDALPVEKASAQVE